MDLNNKKFKINELNKEYILIYTNKHDYTDKLENLIDLKELNYIKDFILLPDDTLYLINDGFYYLKYHNTFIKTYKEPTEMAYAIAVYSESKKQWKDIYKNELQNDLNKYKLTRYKVKKQLDKDNTTTDMDTSSLYGRDLEIQKEWNRKMELLKYERKLFYNELFIQKIKINSKEEYFISKYSDFKDEKIVILNWKSDKALSLLKLPLKSIELKGYYTPDGNNLVDIRYENSNGQKYYFNNANLELQKDNNDNKKKKINIESFFALKEKIPSSEQAYIHSLKNKPIILIEGSAGTGKTTTALEKLAKKSYDGISEEKFLVITKDKIANNYLQKFLKNLSLLNTRIFTIDDFIANIDIEKTFNKIDLVKSEKIANSLFQFYKNITNNIGFYNNKKELKHLMELYEKNNDMEKIITYIEKKEKEIFSFNKKIELIETNITKIETEFLENFSDDNILKQYKKITLQNNEIKQLINYQSNGILNFLKNRNVDSIEKLNKICKKLHVILNKLKLKNHKKKTVQYLISVLNECKNNGKLYNKLNEYNKLRKKYSKNRIIENIKFYISFLKKENLDVDNLYKKSGEILFIEDDSYLNIVLNAIEQIPYFSEYKKLQKDIAKKKKEQKEIEKQIEKLKSDIDFLINIKEFDANNIRQIINTTKQDIPYWKAKLFISETYNIEDIKDDIEPIVINYFQNVIWSDIGISYYINKMLKQEETSFQNKSIIKQLSKLYFYKLTDQVDFDTIVVDEIQDFTYQEIELCRLMTKNLILTGDRLQKISQTGIENWEELYKFNELYKNNIYELTLNFRQTYELANLSFNFRKLILKERFKDISSEYYENQKGFPIPSLYIISKVNEFKKIVNNVLLSIKTNYVSVFPCTIVYSTEVEKDFFVATLSKNYKVGIISNTETDFKSYEIILIHINHIKGKEFPVILSFVSTLTKKMIYLIMSRANFELHLFINNQNNLLSYFNKLSKKNIIKIFYTAPKENN